MASNTESAALAWQAATRAPTAPSCLSCYARAVKFTTSLPPHSLDLLNMRQAIIAQGCRHCHKTGQIRAHGYLYGYAEQGHDVVTRGLRFFVPIGLQI